MPVHPIIISINSRMGLNRVPRAHTCGAVLEMSTAYTSIWAERGEVGILTLHIPLLPTPNKVVGRFRTDNDEDLVTNQEGSIALWLQDYVRCLDSC